MDKKIRHIEKEVKKIYPFCLTPSIKEKAQKKAVKNRRSLSSIVDDLLFDYIQWGFKSFAIDKTCFATSPKFGKVADIPHSSWKVKRHLPHKKE